MTLFRILLTAFALAAPVMAQAYPVKPVTLLVGFAAGGTTDTQARVMARILGEELGQPVNVVNRPGAAGGVAASALKNAPADGHTLYFGLSSTFTFNPIELKTEYDLDDFRYVCALSISQAAIVTTPDKPFKTFNEAIDHARANPGMTFASQTALDKLVMDFITRQEKVAIRVVPTQGGGGMVPLLLGKQVDFAFSGGIHAQYTPSNQMIVLAAFADDRLKAYPQTPTLRELGYNVAAGSISLVAAPRATPDAVMGRLEAAFAKIAKHPEFIDITENKLQFPIDFLGAAEVRQALQRSRETLQQMVTAVKN